MPLADRYLNKKRVVCFRLESEMASKKMIIEENMGIHESMVKQQNELLQTLKVRSLIRAGLESLSENSHVFASDHGFRLPC